MDKLEFTNRNLENLNRCIAENGKVELMKFTELTNRLFDAINYNSYCTEFCVKHDKDTQIRLLIELAEKLGKEKK
jgi:hypothetical protein